MPLFPKKSPVAEPVAEPVTEPAVTPAAKDDVGVAEAMVASIRSKISAAQARVAALESQSGDLALAAVSDEDGANERYRNCLAEIDAARGEIVKLEAASKVAARKREEAQTARRIREQEGQRKRVSKILDKQKEALLACSAAIGSAVAAFHRSNEYLNRARVAFPNGLPPAGCGLSVEEVKALVSQELARIGWAGAVFLGGGITPRHVAAFPAGAIHELNKHMFLGQPEALPSLETKISEAHNYARAVMEGKVDPSTVAPALTSAPIETSAGENAASPVGEAPPALKAAQPRRSKEEVEAELNATQAETLKGPKRSAMEIMAGMPKQILG